MNTWSELSEHEYATIWNRFYTDFKFKPDYYERLKPAIVEPSPFVTFDLSAVNLSDKATMDIDRLFLDSFRTITSTGRVMYSLDWQHTCYRFDPHAVDDIGPIGWYPDGDYYIFLADDFSFGTFGHPWQRLICVFGVSLLGHVENSLRNRLAVLRESTGNEIVG
ncbi:MAG: DUF2716 domain-containing protein [Leptolyngbyaceae cyanobacterium]